MTKSQKCTAKPIRYTHLIGGLCRYMNTVLQDSRKENNALISIIENIDHDAIVTADRNFDSYNNITHLKNKGLKYVIRIKSTVGIVKKFNLPPDKETDLVAEILLTKKQTKEFKSDPEKYRFLTKNSTFDFLPQGSEETYPLKFRIIRIKIADDKYETLVTNL